MEINISLDELTDDKTAIFLWCVLQDEKGEYLPTFDWTKQPQLVKMKSTDLFFDFISVQLHKQVLEGFRNVFTTGLMVVKRPKVYQSLAFMLVEKGVRNSESIVVIIYLTRKDNDYVRGTKSCLIFLLLLYFKIPQWSVF